MYKYQAVSYAREITLPAFVLRLTKKQISCLIKINIKVIKEDNNLIKTTKVTNKEGITKVINKVRNKMSELQTVKILINLHKLKEEVQS